MRNVIFAQLVTLRSMDAAAAPSAELDPVQLVLNASFVVMAVMVILAAMSVVCWFIIGAKLVRLSQATNQSLRFLDQFWDSDLGYGWDAKRLEGVYASLSRVKRAPLAMVFRAGYVELARILSGARPGPDGQARMAGGDIYSVERALRRASASEVTSLETAVPFLATTGSTAPFVGLFGTVWGIMNSFISIAAQQNASLDVVAPGIAEALIATAIGLAAAIPAVMGYNYFVRRIHVLQSEMEAFSSDYLNIVRRHFLME
ncbi:MAG: protein TolQ [Proteobacteria bacterium]|nr:protein TolQ [Pseudomonadota bacterium]